MTADYSGLLMQVGIDLIGPLPRTKNGNRYIITLVDFFSKWPEAAPLPNKKAESVAQFLYKMICRYMHSHYLLVLIWWDRIYSVKQKPISSLVGHALTTHVSLYYIVPVHVTFLYPMKVWLHKSFDFRPRQRICE